MAKKKKTDVRSKKFVLVNDGKADVEFTGYHRATVTSSQGDHANGTELALYITVGNRLIVRTLTFDWKDRGKVKTSSVDIPRNALVAGYSKLEKELFAKAGIDRNTHIS